VAEVSGASREVTDFAVKNLVFSGGDGFDHKYGMIPPWHVVMDIEVLPFRGVKVEGNDVVILTFRVSATVAVEFAPNREQSVASSWLGGVVNILKLTF